MANEILRMNYFDGLKLYQDEFIKEQKYFIRMHRLHNGRLHTWGIVDGLKVEQKNTTSIKITPGMALNLVKKNYINEDSNFYEIVSEEIVNLDDNNVIDLQDVSLTSNEVWVYATYFEATSKEPGTEVDKYWKETAKIEVSNNKPTDEGEYILLAKVTYDLTTKNITNIDQTVPTARAQNAGAFTGSIETETLKLKLDPPAPGGFATINGYKFSPTGGPGVNAIQVNSPMTEFKGPLNIQGDVDITGNLIITGNVDGRDVSADGANLTNHIGAISGNPHKVTAGEIDIEGGANRIINQINDTANNGATIDKERINPGVGSTGWVRVPFLPKKFGNDSSLYPEFEHGITHSTSGSGGAFGVMEIPVPVQATKITAFRIAGVDNHDTIQILLYRGGWNLVSGTIGTPESTQILIQTLTGNSTSPNPVPFDETFNEASFIQTSLNKDSQNISLRVKATKVSDIYLIAAKFE